MKLIKTLTLAVASLVSLSTLGQTNTKKTTAAPENKPSVLKVANDNKRMALVYNGSTILEGRFSNPSKVLSKVTGTEKIEQHILFSSTSKTMVAAMVYGSSEALAAETKGAAQQNFALVRTSHGLSNNFRNNAIYDRKMDWMLELPEGTIIKSSRNIDGSTRFELEFAAKKAELIFRPRYYQKHKNLPHFEPWTYSINKNSITGWSSWWAYFRRFTEKDNNDLLAIWDKKHFADYGYKYIQIDDVYQGQNDKGRKNCKDASGYYGGRPTTWLDWKKDIFPSGLSGYVKSVNKAGFSPAIWMGCFFSDEQTVQEHPEWFVCDENGKPVSGRWVSYVVDATNEEAVNALIRPTFRGLKDAGVEYVKIDQLRHYLYDNLHNHLDWCKKNGTGPDELLRAYLRVAREELGNDTFILSCWGVLPESIGLADACRIGGDGYGPVTMQQYNAWNGIVWRNDPDHCDIAPVKQAKGVGNVKVTESRKAIPKESIIRPALASISGSMLMLSDKPQVYENEDNLYGLRRSSPVLFSVPGQLYNYDSSKTDWIINHKRSEIKSGAVPSKVDADQFGNVCPNWLNEYDTSFEHYSVFHRLNWTKNTANKLKKSFIKFSDLGLDPRKEYLVYEFWQNRMLGVLKNGIPVGELGAFGLESYAIREKLNRPQLVSTNRHISQGAAEIEKLMWENNTIKGRSMMVIEDEYVITIYVPKNYKLKSATVDGVDVKTEQKGNVLKVSYTPKQTASLRWNVSFTKK